MTPKPGYEAFSLDTYRDRYFSATTRDRVLVNARWVNDEMSLLQVSDQRWPDALEVRVTSPQGEVTYLYPQRDEEMSVEVNGAAVRVDPEITTPRLVINLNPVDVDLNGVVDGQDALDVLFNSGLRIDRGETAFPLHLDVNGDGIISSPDIVEIQRVIGQISE